MFNLLYLILVRSKLAEARDVVVKARSVVVIDMRNLYEFTFCFR